MKPNYILYGLIAGLALGLGAAADGFYGFLLVLFLGAVGTAAGVIVSKVVEGEIDLDEVTSSLRGRR